MSSELRGTRIFHRYHQAQHYRDENRHYEDVEGILVSPVRGTAYPLATKSTVDKTTAAGMNRNVRIVDGLTWGHPASPRHHFATERNPSEYEVSPKSAMSFRILSLDGCCEEQVSPITDSSSSISSCQVPDIAMIPAPPRDNNNKKSKMKGIRKSIATMTNDGGDFEKKDEAIEITPPYGMKLRQSSHNRSQFVFDGNLSFDSTSLSPIYATSQNMAYLTPPRASLPGFMLMNYPPAGTHMSMTPMTHLPMTPMTPISQPPHVFASNGPNQQQKKGRNTPPPTPEEQRRRNRAMPSVQYENLVFNQLRQEQLLKEEEHLQLRHPALGLLHDTSQIQILEAIAMDGRLIHSFTVFECSIIVVL